MTKRPVPPISDVAAPYWEGARSGVLRIQQCGRCGATPFPPRRRCPDCGSDDLEWGDHSGRGVIVAATVVHRPPHPAFAGQCPFVLAIVELDDGPRLTSNIVGCPPEEAKIGVAVVVDFDPIDDSDVVVPVFRPAD